MNDNDFFWTAAWIIVVYALGGLSGYAVGEKSTIPAPDTTLATETEALAESVRKVGEEIVRLREDYQCYPVPPNLRDD